MLGNFVVVFSFVFVFKYIFFLRKVATSRKSDRKYLEILEDIIKKKKN